MNLREARNELLASVEAGNAVLMKSSSGIGKSQLQLSVFEELKKKGAEKGEKWGLGTIFAATQTPPDLIGYQFKGDRVFKREGGDDVTVTVTDPSVPLWMLSVPHGDDPGNKPAWFYDKFYLMIEEYGQGEPDVKRAMAEIFLNGGTAPWYLPKGSIRVASTNVGSRYGVTKDFDFCIARRTELNITGDVMVWIEDFADKPYMYQGKVWQTMPVTKVWAKTHPQEVFEEEPKEQGPFCNPRTLCATDRYLQVKAAQNGGGVPLDNPAGMETCAGTMGLRATRSLFETMKFRLELPQYETIVADPDGTEIPGKPDLMMLLSYELAARTLVKDITPVIKYISRLPKDMAITYVSALLRRDPVAFINAPAFNGWVSKNASLVAIVQANTK